ncbi:hypothetical protein MNV49_007852 [Pseudohyphozyma bogoriensis]|nr:hypothetical protein MNV49_007852 [Pseudohyphozyma bogoriensis]
MAAVVPPPGSASSPTPTAAAISDDAAFLSSSSMPTPTPTPAPTRRLEPYHFPPEIINLICAHLYAVVQPPSSLDPHLRLLPPSAPPPAPPSSLTRSLSLSRSSAQPQPVKRAFMPPNMTLKREVFKALSLVDRNWGAEGIRWLWRDVGFGMPGGFQNVLRTVEDYNRGYLIVWPERSERDAGESGWSIRSGSSDGTGAEIVMSPLEMKGIGAVLDELPPTIALDPLDSPLLQTYLLTFSRFRSAGLNRSIRQSSHERFVTPARLLTMIRGTRSAGILLLPGMEDMVDEEDIRKGRLEMLGFTEFMDSAISKEVLEEVLFRGGWLAEYEEVDEEVERVTITLASPGIGSDDRVGRRVSVERGRGGTAEFRARELQSSVSRSPGRTRVESVEEEEDEHLEDDVDMSLDREQERASRRHRQAPRLERRASGSAFVRPSAPGGGGVGEGEDDRGRIGRRGRSLLPPSSLASRSSSVPAEFVQHHRRTASSGLATSSTRSRSRSISRIEERSSSVPAAPRWEEEEVKKRKVVLFEGSKRVRPVRALDLCGCVSSAFTKALEDMSRQYKLGPAGLFADKITKIDEREEDDDEDEAMSDEDGGRELKRIFFPHLRRLGLCQALMPSHHLTALVTSFPYLTHLDLTSTLASPQLVKHLALAGQKDHAIGGRTMRLKSLSLARCRLLSGGALVGLLCGDCPPFTSEAGGEEEGPWGAGESISELVDLSLFGDSSSPSSLSIQELRLILTISPAFTSQNLRYLDLSSTPLTDALLEEAFPVQPNLAQLGLAYIRGISVGGVAKLLSEKCRNVEVIDLSHSCPAAGLRIASAQRRATFGTSGLSIMELHTHLLSKVASLTPSGVLSPEEAEERTRERKTLLRVVELDEKALEGIQGGAGDWKVVWGRGRRGWYVDTGVTSYVTEEGERKLKHLPREDDRRAALLTYANSNGVVGGDVGWHMRKMEVLRGEGMMGREDGLYAFHALG